MSTNALNLEKENSYPNQNLKNNPNTNAHQNIIEFTNYEAAFLEISTSGQDVSVYRMVIFSINDGNVNDNAIN